jgi:amidase
MLDPFAGLTATRDALAAGDVTSAELVDRALAAIAASQSTINAFRCTRADAARAEAAESDRRLAAGERAPLLGVPIAIKDDVDLAGETTPFGCRGDFPVKTVDSWTAARLKDAGAVIVGKTNTPEFGQWPFTSGPAFGVTRSPWNLAHTPGGSSGGSAAAVAAGLVPAAVGSDGAGSVRIPAAWSHLVGIKPQRGRISLWPEPDRFNGLPCNGPLARTVADAALLLDVLTGNQPDDPHRPPPPDEPFAQAARRDPGALRIALSFRAPYSGTPWRLHPEIRAGVERLGAVLAGMGHEIVEAEPHYGIIGLSFMPRSMTGVRRFTKEIREPALLDPRTRHNATVGKALAPALPLAKKLEALHHRQVGGIFKRADVVLAPTTAQPPPAADAIDALGGWDTDKMLVATCPFAYAWNVLGWPGVNVPIGLTADGLPIGAQLLGPADSEARLISLAAQLEAAERWDERRPDYSPS